MEKCDLKGLTASSVLQIGLGRLGQHFNRHLNAYFKTDPEGPVRLLSRSENLSEVLKKQDLKYIFIATPDSEIDSYVKVIPDEIRAVHFSGFYYNKKALGVHPVQSFSKEGVFDFNGIDFVVDGKLDGFLKKLFPTSMEISPGLKKTYHTYLSVAANSMQLLNNQLGASFSEQTGLPKDLLKKIVIQSLEREFKFGEKSFSGPWVRNENTKQLKQVELIKDENLKDLNRIFQNTIRRYKNECAEI